MKVLITGNLGYIGPSLIHEIRSSHPFAEIVGMDLGLFSHCLTGVKIAPDINLDKQIYKDVRNISEDDLDGFDFTMGGQSYRFMFRDKTQHESYIEYQYD